MKRRTFLEVSLAGAAGVLTGGLPKLLSAASTSKTGETFLLGGRFFGQPARVWGDAADGRGDLGLAA